MDCKNSDKLIVSSALVTIDGDTRYTYGTIYIDKYGEIEGEFLFPNLNTIYNATVQIESITGKTDQEIYFEIFKPFLLGPIFPNTTFKVVINQVSLYGKSSLKPDLIECFYKNSLTTDSDIVHFKGEEYQLENLTSGNIAENEGKIGTKLTIDKSKLPIHEIEGLLDDVGCLLSIYQRIPVKIAIVNRWSNGHFVSGEIYRQSLHFRSVFPMKSLFAQDLCPFITAILPVLMSKKLDYNFVVLIHYYCYAYCAIFDEHRYIFASIFMEAFKYYWAKNISGYYQEIGSNGVIKAFKLNASSRPLTFEVLLLEAANHIGYTIKDTAFIQNRNALFHSGMPVSGHAPTSHPTSDLWNELLTLFDDIDGVLMTLLEYTDDIQTARYPNNLNKVID